MDVCGKRLGLRQAASGVVPRGPEWACHFSPGLFFGSSPGWVGLFFWRQNTIVHSVIGKTDVLFSVDTMTRDGLHSDVIKL